MRTEEVVCEFRRRSWWERHGSWAIMLLVAGCIGQVGFHLGTYMMHEALREQAEAHQVEVDALKYEQLVKFCSLWQGAQLDATAKPQEKKKDAEASSAGSEAEQPRQP